MTDIKKPTVTKANAVKKKTDAGKSAGKKEAGVTGSAKPAGTAGSRGSTKPGAATGSRGSAKPGVATGSRGSAKPGAATGSRGNTKPGTATGSRGSAKSTSATGRTRKGGVLRNMDPGAKALLGALVIGILCAVIITCIMRSKMLKVTVQKTEYIMGSRFDIASYVTPVNDKATVYYDIADFEPEGPGEYTVKYTVTYGKQKAHKKLKLTVVDTDNPVISGDDSISVLLGEEIDWSLYYTVTDSQSGLEDQITASPEIDTSMAGKYTTTISVVDWAEHISTMSVTVSVVDLSETGRYAVQAARLYKKESGADVSEDGVYVKEADGEDDILYYIRLDSNIIYVINADGSCNRYETGEDEDSQTKLYELSSEIKTEGERFVYASIADFT